MVLASRSDFFRVLLERADAQGDSINQEDAHSAEQRSEPGEGSCAGAKGQNALPVVRAASTCPDTQSNGSPLVTPFPTYLVIIRVEPKRHKLLDTMGSERGSCRAGGSPWGHSSSHGACSGVHLYRWIPRGTLREVAHPCWCGGAV